MLSAHLANAEGVLCLNEFWQRSIVATFFAALSCFRTRHCVALALRRCNLSLPKEDFYQSIGEVSHVSLVPTQLQRWFDYLVEHPQSIHTQAVLLGGNTNPC